ncbi:hypothetical protein B296_00050308, partial [Ensete ventricosum]
EFRSIFHASSRKFKILTNPNVLAYVKSYEHDFTKKYDGYKVSQCCARSQVSIGFLCTISKIQNSGHSEVLAHGMSYEHGFTEKMRRS